MAADEEEPSIPSLVLGAPPPVVIVAQPEFEAQKANPALSAKSGSVITDKPDLAGKVD